MKRRFETNFGFLLLAVLFIAGPGAMSAQAQTSTCIPGIPCVVNKTTNDPLKANDGPNVTGPNKSKTDNAGCDADFMNQIYARAYLEAERENVMNKISIRKPDSVLEYTCFDQMVALVGQRAGPLFTESALWNNITVPIGGAIQRSPRPNVTLNVLMGPTKLDTSLQALILSSLNTYTTTNFGHNFLGGSAGTMSLPATSIYNCDFMNSVHFLAKCNNFAADDQFFTFDTLATFDPRALPALCAAGQTGIKTALINLAGNKDFASVNFDPVVTYLNRMTPEKCDTIAPVPTGLKAIIEDKSVDSSGNVKVTKTTIYDEKVCSNPACYYDQKTGKCKL